MQPHDRAPGAQKVASPHFPPRARNSDFHHLVRARHDAVQPRAAPRARSTLSRAQGSAAAGARDAGSRAANRPPSACRSPSPPPCRRPPPSSVKPPDLHACPTLHAPRQTRDRDGRRRAARCRAQAACRRGTLAYEARRPAGGCASPPRTESSLASLQRRRGDRSDDGDGRRRRTAATAGTGVGRRGGSGRGTTGTEVSL